MGSPASLAPGYDTRELAADVIGLIEALQLGQPILVGHSMGGITAAVVAKERPDLVRGLVLEDPAFVSRSGEQDAEKEQARRARDASGWKTIKSSSRHR